jgi:hypothetical protein
LAVSERKCLHLYFYFVDAEFGIMHVRLQTWLPLTIQVCINGREWLAREMDKAGIKYQKSIIASRGLPTSKEARN